METSIFLAKVIGLVIVISVTAILIRYKQFLAFGKEAVMDTTIIYLSGFTIIIIGVLVIVSHFVWTRDWRLVVTLLGWSILLKGLGRVIFPDAVARMIKRKSDSRWFIVGEIAVLAIGIYLLYHGFIAH